MRLAVTVTLLLAAVSHLAAEDAKRTVEQVFKGRCLDYNVKYSEAQWQRVTVNCDSLWSTFYEDFNSFSQDKCEVKPTRYDDFFKLVRQELPKDKVLFWSGTKALSLRLGGRGLVSLEHTLAGSLVDSLIDCRGSNTERCPIDRCANEMQESFWSGASAEFARSAKGTVHVLLNGTRHDEHDAFYENSTFALIELPNLSKEVTKVVAFISHDLGRPIREHCGEKSLATLEKKVKEFGKEFVCIPEPDVVRYLQCVDDPDNKECPKAHASKHLLQAHLVLLFTWAVHAVKNLL